MLLSVVQSYYQTLYKESKDWRPEFTIQDAKIITPEDEIWLQMSFNEEEIVESIKWCTIDKAPGPDVSLINFYLTFWDLVKEVILGTMQYFYDHKVFDRSMNATYVALIPKKAGAVELRNFRPISLITGMYKMIAKVLAERMKRVKESLVNKH